MTADAELAFASISEIGKLYRRRKLSPVELVRFLLDRIARLNPRLNAYITVAAEQATKQAKKAQAELFAPKGRKRDRGPLHGIPVSLKDNIYTEGIRTTAGSKILRDFVPLHDAPVVASLKSAGAIILGKTNMHEFAYGVTTENPHYGPARNPWDRERSTGGSSGGSASALAAGLCYGSIGTDTGGSIRIPASLCGVVGLKPGLGRVNADGVVPLSPTLDAVGPLARSAVDVALQWEAICIRRNGESRMLRGKSFASRGRRPRLGIPQEFFFDVIEPEIQILFESAVRILQKHGARLKKVSLPLLKESEDAGNQIAWPEATLYHQEAGWYPDRAGEYGVDVRSRLEMGTKVSAVKYLRALELREQFIAGLHLTMQENEIDALVVPTTPIAAPRIGEESITIGNVAHPARALLLRLNRPANLAGVPAISVPCGFTQGGLPAGLQFIGAVGAEGLLLELAQHFVEVCPSTLRPGLDSVV